MANEGEYEAYLKERRALVEAEYDQAKSLDKALLTLSGGALALSITFIHEIAPSPYPTSIYLLVGSWSAFGLSVISTLIGFYVSVFALRLARDKNDLGIKGAPEAEIIEFDKKHQWKLDLIDYAVWVSMASFIIGVGLVAAFAFVNLSISNGGSMHG